jgi:hypothetical protein
VLDRVATGPEVMLETCVSIDVLQGKIPQSAADMLVARIANPSAICLTELTCQFERQDLEHPETSNFLTELRGVIEEDILPRHLTAPSMRVLGEAGWLRSRCAVPPRIKPF